MTNTPWHERTAYVCRAPGTHRVAKGMHVSPFLPMGLAHRFTIGEPRVATSALAVDDCRRTNGPGVRAASMALRRSPAGPPSPGRLLWRYPLMTLRVSFAIYRQALAPAAQGVPFHPHPDRTAACPAVDVVEAPDRSTEHGGAADGLGGAPAGTPVAARFLAHGARTSGRGTLVVVDATGTRRFGDGDPEVDVVVHDPSSTGTPSAQGSVGLGRDYVDGCGTATT